MLKKNYAMFTVALILTMALLGCAGLPPAPVLEKGDDTATVYFIMGGSGVTLTGGGLTFGTQFTLWDSDIFLSAIGGKEYVVLNFKAGTHYFMASGDNWYISQAELAPGKSYFYDITAVPGFRTANALLHIMEPNDPEIDATLKKCREISPKTGGVNESKIKEAGKKLAEAKGGSEKIDLVTANKGR